MLPQDEAAERALIGCLLIDPDAVMWCREVDLQPGEFFHANLGRMYGAAVSLSEQGRAVEYIAMASLVEDADLLTRLATEQVSSLHTRHFAGIIKDHARRRRLIAAAADIASQAHNVETPVEEMLASVSERFFGAADVTENASHLFGSDEAIVEYLVNQQLRADRLANNPNGQIITGMPSLDRILGDIEPGQFLVVGARTSIGKTAFMESVAEHNALRGHKVAYYHLELSHQKMLDRQMARWSGVPVQKLRQGYDGPELQRAMDLVRSRLRNMIYIHCPGWTAERIAADAAQLMARHDVSLVVVDYLGKLAYPTGARGFNEAGLVSQQVETIKNISERLNVPVIMGSQVSRDFKQSADKKPTVNDLKGSGEIENRSNKVIILHRPNERQEGQSSEIVEAYVEKNEDGMCGMATLRHLMGRFHIVSTTDVEQVDW